MYSCYGEKAVAAHGNWRQVESTNVLNAFGIIDAWEIAAQRAIETLPRVMRVQYSMEGA
jgi:hypothetical protein